MKTILLTGSSRGIGLATAKTLANQGHKLALFSIEPMDEVLKDKAFSKAMKSGNIIHGIMDVTNPEDWDAAIAQTIKQFSHIDVLINNAGILVDGNLPETPLDKQLILVDINCKGVLTGCHKIAAHLQGRSNAKIINLSSASAIYGQPELANYSASKFYIRGLTEALNIEYAKCGIKVVDVMPLFVASDMTKNVSITSIERMGISLTPKDVAKTLCKLVNMPNKKINKTHYPVGLPAKFLDGLAQVMPYRVARFINAKIAG